MLSVSYRVDRVVKLELQLSFVIVVLALHGLHYSKMRPAF
jgi:hypothetical protein